MVMESIAAVIFTLGILAVICVAYGIVAGSVRRSFSSPFDRVRRTLPAFDCGACGYRSCIDFAEAVVIGRADHCGCIPGGPRVAHDIADSMESEVTPGEAMVAAVNCRGGDREVVLRARYEGIGDCRAALLVENGVRACTEGCLGLGTCVRACPFGAISVGEDGIASVNRLRCNGCGVCIGVCPRGLLSLMPATHKIYLGCSSHDAGPSVLERCRVGCTACGDCVTITPSGAVTMQDRLPRLDYGTPGENFLAAAYCCPSNCFVDVVKARPKANIGTECAGCGECRSVCPVPGAIAGETGGRHIVNKSLCIGCGRCLGACDAHAISLWGSLGYEGTPIQGVRNRKG